MTLFEYIGLITFALIAILWLYVVFKSFDSKPMILGLISTNKDHEERGDLTCPKCNKRFIKSLLDCTFDVVCKLDRPDLLCVSEAYCPHCSHFFELGHTPMPQNHLLAVTK